MFKYFCVNAMHLYFFHIVLFITTHQCSLTRVEGTCPNIDGNDRKWHYAVYERKEIGKALKNHVFLSRIVRSEMECSLTCLRHAQCESYNYQDEGERHLCELNDQTRLTTSHDLLQRTGFSYYGFGMEPCANVICQNGGTCHATFGSLAVPYCCQCEKRYRGDNCQHFMGFRFTNSSSGDLAVVEVTGSGQINSFSFCLRMKATEQDHDISTPMSYVSNETSVALQLHTNRTIRIIIKDQYSDFSYVSLLDDTWHHVCFTWENIDGNLTLYINGLLIGQKRGVNPGLTFDSSGRLVIGQLQKATDQQFILNESYLGDVTDVNVWRDVLTPSIIKEQSRACYGQVGDLLAWSEFSTGYLQFQDEAYTIPTECKGFDLSATFDLEFPRRTKEDYVLLPWPAFPALAAFTLSLFVSFTDTGDKTFFNYYDKGALNEIFIHERSKRFTVRIKGIARQHEFFISPDGLWHHVAVTWENINGSYEIFVNGQVKGRGEGLENGTTITPGGTVALGNDKDAGHIGFQVRDAYVGNISRVNLWDYVLPRETIALLSQRCGRENGETIAWRDIRAGSFHGVVNIREPSFCQRLQ